MSTFSFLDSKLFCLFYDGKYNGKEEELDWEVNYFFGSKWLLKVALEKRMEVKRTR